MHGAIVSIFMSLYEAFRCTLEGFTLNVRKGVCFYNFVKKCTESESKNI